MAKGTWSGSVPPDDPMFTGGPQLHVPMPASELRRQNPSQETGGSPERRLIGHRAPAAVAQSATPTEQEIIDLVVEATLRIEGLPLGSPFRYVLDESRGLPSHALEWLRQRTVTARLASKASISGRYIDCQECPHSDELLTQMDSELPQLFGHARTDSLRVTRRPSDEEISSLERRWAQRSLRDGAGSWYGIAELRHSDGRTIWALMQDSDHGPEITSLDASKADVLRYLLNYGYPDAPLPTG